MPGDRSERARDRPTSEGTRAPDPGGHDLPAPARVVRAYRRVVQCAGDPRRHITLKAAPCMAPSPSPARPRIRPTTIPPVAISDPGIGQERLPRRRAGAPRHATVG